MNWFIIFKWVHIQSSLLDGVLALDLKWNNDSEIATLTFSLIWVFTSMNIQRLMCKVWPFSFIPPKVIKGYHLLTQYKCWPTCGKYRLRLIKCLKFWKKNSWSVPKPKVIYLDNLFYFFNSTKSCLLFYITKKGLNKSNKLQPVHFLRFGLKNDPLPSFLTIWPLWATDIWINGYLGQDCIFCAVVIICSPFSNLRIEVGVDRGLSVPPYVWWAYWYYIIIMTWD